MNLTRIILDRLCLNMAIILRNLKKIKSKVRFLVREYKERYNLEDTPPEELKFSINNCLTARKVFYLKCEHIYLEKILHIDPSLYEGLGIVTKWDFEKDLKFKVTNPGEQMTNTFHKLVYENESEWYPGKFY